MSVFRSQEGRVRIGWRLSLYFLLVILFAVPGSLLPSTDVAAQSAVVLIAGLLAGWIVLGLDGRRPGALGFYLHRDASPESAFGLALGVVVGSIAVLGMFALGGVGWTGQEGSVSGWILAGFGSLWFFLIPAAAEEVLMRGYLFQALADSFGNATGLWATSILFGLMHLGNPNWSYLGLANIVVAGLFLGVVYLKTRSLWYATAAHLGWNWAHGFLADLPVSGLDLVDAPLLEGVSRGPEWIGGGAFGPEGIHVSYVVIDGVIDIPRTRAFFRDRPDEIFLKANCIADTVFHLATQDPSAWTFEIDVRPFGEKW